MMNLKVLICIAVVLSLYGHTSDAIKIELQSYNLPDYYIHTAHRLHGGTATLQRQTQPVIWKIVSPGLCNRVDTVSIRIGLQDSNIYLRHRNGLIYAEANDRSNFFANSACFYVRYNKWFPGHAAIESVNSPGYFIRHQLLQLKLHQYSSTTIFEMDASYRILQPQCKRFRSYNINNHYFGLTGRKAYISPTPELWIPIRPGLAGHNGSVSFRSCHNARKYLRHSKGHLYNDNFENTRLFKLDATFTERKQFYPGTTAYESVNYPNSFVRHYRGRLRIDSYSAAPLYKKDASYYEVGRV
jgi:hypothetical protein